MSASVAITDPLAPAWEASIVKREAQDEKIVSVSSHARYAVRFTMNELAGDFATNRHA